MSNKKNINVLIVGADGMLGTDVLKTFNDLARDDRSRINRVTGIVLKDLDITDGGTVRAFFENSSKYDWCVNCAAYTDTVQAEGAARKVSYAVNALGTKHLAEACRDFGTKFLHVSTDYVSSELGTYDDPFPTNNYGLHKLVGELFIKTTLPESRYCIVRTSWLYGAVNSKSFIHKFVKNLAAVEADSRKTDGRKTKSAGQSNIYMVNDQASIPTSTKFLSDFITACVETDAHGVLSGVPPVSDEGGVSRYEFAASVMEWLRTAGFVSRRLAMSPKNTDRRTMHWPEKSVLPTEGVDQSNVYQAMASCPDWEEDLERFMAEHGAAIWKSFNA